jgi:hypothetical protein
MAASLISEKNNHIEFSFIQVDKKRNRYKSVSDLFSSVASRISANLCFQVDSKGLPLWSSGQSSWLHNGEVLWFLWGTNWIYICYVEESRPPLWSSGQSSWLHDGEVLCFLWGTNWIYICYVEESIPPLCSSGQSSWLMNGDVLCFLWGTNWIYICYVEESRPPLWSSGQSSWLHNVDVLCFLWGTNWIDICYVEESRPPLWSSGQSSWLQMQRWGFDSRCYQNFWEVVGPERSPLSLMSTIEELLERKCSGSGLDIWEYGRKDPSRWPRNTLLSADKRLSLGKYFSLADSSHGGFSSKTHKEIVTQKLPFLMQEIGY